MATLYVLSARYLANWRCQRSFNAPAKTNQAHIDTAPWEPSPAAPLCQRQSLPTPLNEVVIPLVTRLLSGCGPSTILRFVVAVIVDAVERVIGWAQAHVFDEVYKRVTPAIAHGYSSASVVAESFVFRVVTSVFHVVPSTVFDCFRCTMCAIVTTTRAAATLDQQSSYLSDTQWLGVAATATEKPARMTRFAWCWSKSGQLIKLLARLKPMHGVILLRAEC